MKVYRKDVWDRIDSRGVYVFSDVGEVVEVNGVEYVSHGTNLIRRDASWHESEEDAAAVAAEKIEKFVTILIGQARQLRKQEHAHASA